MNKPLIDYLIQFTESDWCAAVESLLADIHGVDRNAVQVWFRFYPLEVRRFIENAEDKDEVKQQLQLLGNYDLAEQIDTSHKFLYGHRYWPQVKKAIEAEAESFSDDSVELADLVRKLSMQTCERTAKT